MSELTPRQAEILCLILNTVKLCGYQPSIREIGRKLQIRSTNGVVCHLQALERKGYIVQRSVARALGITGKAKRWFEDQSRPIAES